MTERSKHPFWETKSLDEMNQAEWESLCDGCGQCCLHKLEDEDTGEIGFTNVVCKLLDMKSCQCSDYDKRQTKVPDCVQLTPATAGSLPWLPPTCAYRKLAHGADLDWWHPLVSGDANTVHAAGISVRGKSVNENMVGDLEDHVTSWLVAGNNPFKK